MKKINILYTFAFLCILTIACTKSYAAAAGSKFYIDNEIEKKWDTDLDIIQKILK